MQEPLPRKPRATISSANYRPPLNPGSTARDSAIRNLQFIRSPPLKRPPHTQVSAPTAQVPVPTTQEALNLSVFGHSKQSASHSANTTYKNHSTRIYFHLSDSLSPLTHSLPSHSAIRNPQSTMAQTRLCFRDETVYFSLPKSR